MDELINDREDVPADDSYEADEGPEIIYEGQPGYEREEVKAQEDSEYEEEIVEAEEAAVEAEKPKKRAPRIPAKQRINDLSRRYYSELRRAEKAEIELAALREERDRLQKSYEHQNKAVMNSQESMLDAHIQRAKQLKAKAIEDGDVESQLAADEALAVAVSDKRNLDAWKMQQKLYEESQPKERVETRQQRNHVDHAPAEVTPEAEDWLADNAWFDERTDDFDPDLHQKAMSYAQHLESRYQRMGLEHKVMSHEYFDEIDRYMKKHLTKKEAPQRQGDLVMNRPRNTVAPVQRAHVPGHREVYRMSREDQEMARAMGWDDKKWIHYKKEAEKMEATGRLKMATGNSR